MLFSKNMEPRCAYCAHGAQMNESSILCKKKGVVSPGDQCRSFQYDPLKRVPPKPVSLDFSQFKDEDFSL